MTMHIFERRTQQSSSPALEHAASNCSGAAAATAPASTADEIKEWLINKVAELAGVEVNHIDANEPLAFYGLDSVAAVSLSGELQDWLGRKVPPTLVYDYPSIQAMVGYLSAGS